MANQNPAVERRLGPEDKDELLERIQRQWAAQERPIGGLGDPQLTTRAQDGGWSVKDHLAHLAAWEQRLLAHLRGLTAPEGSGVDTGIPRTGDVDDFNAAAYAPEQGPSRGGGAGRVPRDAPAGA